MQFWIESFQEAMDILFSPFKFIGEQMKRIPPDVLFWMFPLLALVWLASLAIAFVLAVPWMK